MNDTYFTKFPIISYANTNVRNITERVKILHNKLINNDSFYPIQIGPDDRSDIVANGLYGDALRDWLLYLNNNIVDPYFGWYMNDDQFAAYIIDKYGSVTVAQQQVHLLWPHLPTRPLDVCHPSILLLYLYFT